ncbi:hypothetical protein [Alistipes communis]|uniref:hypothetical protein n=1 Tax=Alistipes communis TaxID=2585118 RepID=UPI003AB11917
MTLRILSDLAATAAFLPAVFPGLRSDAVPGDLTGLLRDPMLRAVCLGLATVVLILAVAKMVHIGHMRRQMRGYADFLRDACADGPVEPLLYRKWCETVEAYNRSRRRWPFCLLCREADAGIFRRREGPPPVAGLSSCNSPKTGVSPKGGMRKKKS